VPELRDAGRLDMRLAAVALLDLDGSRALLRASLVHAAAGVARTPAGLLVAA
jgi:hypothetical protein